MTGVRMLGARVVAEDKPQPVTQFGSNAAHGRVRATTKRALEITILDQGDGRVCRSQHWSSSAVTGGLSLSPRSIGALLLEATSTQGRSSFPVSPSMIRLRHLGLFDDRSRDRFQRLQILTNHQRRGRAFACRTDELLAAINASV